MNKILKLLLPVAFVAGMAIADPVYDRVIVTNSPSLGAITWTNTQSYASIEVSHIWIIGNSVATDTTTVKRVTSPATYDQGNTLTQTVATIAIASSIGDTNINNNAGGIAAYLKPNDKLTFAQTATASTGLTAVIEFKVFQH